MGKKVKTGKARRDKYYKLAKETGYRSRAAFKLIQLNRKFSFLQNSRVVLDLCAAPGGWLQVAAQNTPLASIIVGVDLVPILNIRRVTTLQEDITTEKCVKNIKKVLQQWRVDCVLHDGAPNVGQNWLHDAYQQACLTLAAVKLCTVLLKKGGWFVTKVFRSKDYNALLWVFSQLFRHVHTTKPHASRTESSEVYVVCRSYLAPDKVDPKFLDAKYVFQEVHQAATKLPQLDLRRPSTVIKSAEGYPEGETILYHTMTATEFMTCTNHLERLADVTKIQFTEADSEILNHPLTTNEIRSLCEDVKVINKRDINNILKWRKAYRKEKFEEKQSEKTQTTETPADDSEAEEAVLDEKIASLKEQERLDKKRKTKKVKEEKTKLKSKLAKSRESTSGVSVIEEDMELFALKSIKSSQDLNVVSEGDLRNALEVDDEMEEKPSIRKRPEPTTVDRDTRDYMEQTDSEASDSDADNDYMKTGLMSDADPGDKQPLIQTNKPLQDEDHPLVTHLEDTERRSTRLLNEWFSKDSFAGIEDEQDEAAEINQMHVDFKRQGGRIYEPPLKKSCRKQSEEIESNETGMSSMEAKNTDQNIKDVDYYKEENLQRDDVDGDISTDSEDEDIQGVDHESATLAAQLISNANVSTAPVNSQQVPAKTTTSKKKTKNKAVTTNGFEIVPVQQIPLPTHLDEVGLALGAAIATSRKRRREIIEDGFNRYMYDDTHLPSWFVAEEQSHRARPLPITKAEVEEYKERQKELDARPIKKIAEAKARKKRRLALRLKKARKRADGIDDTQDVSEKEKWSQIKQIYKKAGLLKKNKKDVTYVVTKKGGGRRVPKPSGVKGHYKAVDPRGKKDKKNMKSERGNKKRKHHHSRR